MHFWLHHTAHCTAKIVSAQFCVIRKGGTEGGEWQGDMHMVAARLGCQSIMVGTRWANLAACTHLIGDLFLAGKATWALSRCLTSTIACSLSGHG